MQKFVDVERAVLMAADQNGSGSPPQALAIGADELKRRAQLAREIAASFGQIVSLLMRSPQHRLTMLGELEWLVMPALVRRQFRIAEGVSQDKGVIAPVAAVLWAHVNDEVDRRIADNLNTPIKLKPDEWHSGEHTWIVEAIGDPTAVGATLQLLKQNDFKDRIVRMRVRGKDGRASVGRLELKPEGAGLEAKAGS